MTDTPQNTVTQSMAREAFRTIAHNMATQDDYHDTVRAIESGNDPVLLRLRALTDRVTQRRREDDPVAVKARVLRRWIDDEALPDHARMRSALNRLMDANVYADDRAVGAPGRRFAVAREAEDAAEAALEAIDTGAENVLDLVRVAHERFDALSSGIPKDEAALNDLGEALEDVAQESESPCP